MDVTQATLEVEGNMRKIEDQTVKMPMTKAEERKLQTILDKSWALSDAMKKRRANL